MGVAQLTLTNVHAFIENNYFENVYDPGNFSIIYIATTTAIVTNTTIVNSYLACAVEFIAFNGKID